MKYTFSNRKYEAAHAEAPKGRGFWAFIITHAEIPEISPSVYIEQDGNHANTIFWVPGIWTLTEAKKRASIMLEANEVPFGTTIYVAP